MLTLAQRSGLVLAVTKGRVSLIYTYLSPILFIYLYLFKPRLLPITDSAVQKFIVSTDNR